MVDMHTPLSLNLRQWFSICVVTYLLTATTADITPSHVYTQAGMRVACASQHERHIDASPLPAFVLCALCLQRRMPSGMQGFKKSVEEGGIRNYLAIKGPGVPAGVLDNTLVHITDILPTVADLAGVHSQHLPWDGISFANVLKSNSKPSNQISKQQAERVVVEMSPHCWSPDMVPELGADRKVVRTQQLLDLDKGGVEGKGFQRCLGLRYKDYKWLGESNRVYRYATSGTRGAWHN